MKKIFNAVYDFLDAIYINLTKSNPYIWAHLVGAYWLTYFGAELLNYLSFNSMQIEVYIFAGLTAFVIGLFNERIQYLRKFKSNPDYTAVSAKYRRELKEFKIDMAQDIAFNLLGILWAVCL